MGLQTARDQDRLCPDGARGLCDVEVGERMVEMIDFQPKPRECKQCGSTFTPVRPLAYICSPLCAAKYVKADRKAEVQRTKERKEAVKTNGKRKTEAQAALNRWIVHGRDADEPCISCGRHHAGIYHAGHYRSRGSAPHLALDPRNLHKQCAPCNLYLHGNLIEYRKGLIHRYGLEYVEALESDQGVKHYSGSDYDDIKVKYRTELRLLKEKEKV